MKLFDQKGKMNDIDLSEVHSIERDSKNRSVLFYTARNVYHAPVTISEFGQAYEEFGFHRICKNQLINIHRVTHRDKGVVYIGEKAYHVSRRNELIIKKIIKNRL